MKDKETIRAMEKVLTEVANLLGTPQGNVEAMGDEIRRLQADKDKWMEVAEASASLKARHDALDRENAGLRTEVDRLKTDLSLMIEDSDATFTRLRDKHYRECEEIARSLPYHADIARAIAKTREGK